MAYFNYLVKCIIRRFVRLFFTKKTFVVILIFVSLFVFLKSEGYCSSDILLTPGLVTLYQNDVLQYSLSPLPNASDVKLSSYYSYFLESGVSYRVENSGDYYLADVIPQIPTSSRSSVTTSISEAYTYVRVSGHVPCYSGDDYVFTSGFTGYVLIPSSGKDIKFYKVDSLYSGNEVKKTISGSSYTPRDYGFHGMTAVNGSLVSGTNRFAVYELPTDYDYTLTFTGSQLSGGYNIKFLFADDLSVGSPYFNMYYYNGYQSSFSFKTRKHKYLLCHTVFDFSTVQISLSYTASGLNDIDSSVQSSGQQVSTSINQGTDKINSSITDSDVDVSTDLPTDNTTDITQSGFDSIFTTIKNTFTSSSSEDLVLTIPFTGKSFTINFDNVYGGFNSGIVGTLIKLFWWYLVSVFIVKDIYSKINKIKSGNIESIETTNIKEDIL